MSATAQITPDAVAIRELATSVIGLLRTATKEVERDSEAAKSTIARATLLLQIEADRRACSDPEVRSGGLAPWQIHRVKLFVESHLSGSIRIEDLSLVARLSKTHFSRAFRQSFGETPHSYVVRRRIDLARHLMLTTDIALCELAVACGLADQAHLSKLFRHFTGQSPAAWRRGRRQPIRASGHPLDVPKNQFNPPSGLCRSKTSGAPEMALSQVARGGAA